MTKRILPTPEQLRELLHYEPETGKLFWKERPIDFFRSQRAFSAWNNRYSGLEAFTAESAGYRVGRIFDVMHKGHRVAWAIHYGDWPLIYIDHANGDRSDNRIENLREASSAQNSMNQGGKANKKGTLKGASWFSSRKIWKSEIRYNGKRKFLGHFMTEAEAHAAYCRASQVLHREFARTH